jgi:hypothetical protein
MALQARQFFLDVQARQFVSGASSTLPASSPLFFEEDVEAIELYFLQPSTTPGRVYDYLDLSGATVKFAVGTTSPAALQTAWAAISTSVVSTITGVSNGGSGSDEVQRISLSPKPTGGSYIIELPARNVTVASVTAGVFTCSTPHGLFDGQAVTLTGFTTPTGFSNGSALYVAARTSQTFQTAATAGGTAITAPVASSGGTAQLGKISTGSIAYNASPTTLQAAIAAVSASASVTGVAGETYTLTFNNNSGGIDLPLVALAGSTLAAAPGLAANLSFSTANIASLISAGTTAVNVEVEIAEGAVRQTFRTSATLSDDLITSSSPSPLPAVTATSFQLQDSGGGLWTIEVTPSGELQLAKL